MQPCTWRNLLLEYLCSKCTVHSRVYSSSSQYKYLLYFLSFVVSGVLAVQVHSYLVPLVPHCALILEYRSTRLQVLATLYLLLLSFYIIILLLQVVPIGMLFVQAGGTSSLLVQVILDCFVYDLIFREEKMFMKGCGLWKRNVHDGMW